MISEDEPLRDRGRRLRTECADEERKLWEHLRAKRFGGFKFRRQHRIGPYFADFCCVAWHLIIELDGSQHAEPEQERKDALRTAFLAKRGYRVMRFWNQEVNMEMENVLEAIYAALTDS
jgi:very-short-patch-repair endonuclease